MSLLLSLFFVRLLFLCVEGRDDDDDGSSSTKMAAAGNSAGTTFDDVASRHVSTVNDNSISSLLIFGGIFGGYNHRVGARSSFLPPGYVAEIP
jgi:hypothetical protein